MATMDLFGEPPIKNAEKEAEAKFENLPWQFFDDVRDASPNKLVGGDFAITRVINSRISSDDIEAGLATWRSKKGDSILAKVPLDARLEEQNDDSAELDRVRDLFFRLRVEGNLSMSKISKVLCRKRPKLIPMLDNVVTRRCLYPVAKRWKKHSEEAPSWFLKRWNGWDGKQHPEDPSVYLRMVRDLVKTNKASLMEIRAHLRSHPATGVPDDAPLVRIWEAIVFWVKRP
jgi:hypothetical protein